MADKFLKDCFSPLVEWREEGVRNFSSTNDFRESSRITQCSRSSPVTIENCGKLILSRSKLKKHCRNGVNPNARKGMWLDVVEVTDADSVLLVKAFGEPDEEEVVTVANENMFGLGTELTSFPSFHLRWNSFNPGHQRVMTAILRKFFRSREGAAGVFAPLVPVLGHLMLHFIDEWEVFALISHLLARTAWLDHTKAQSDASRLTLKSLLRSHAASTLSTLHDLKPDHMTLSTFLDELTKNWFLWPFYRQPFWIAVRVVDMYLVEGPKILYRMALAALKLFALHSSKLELDSSVAVQELLCSLSHHQKVRWFREAFAITRLSWGHILKEWQFHQPHSTCIDESDGDELYSSDSGDAARGQVVVVPDPSSELIQSSGLWFSLWGWLPEWVFCKEPECLFRASRDGYNLRTLYRKCEDHPCIVLLVKTIEERVFGAFIASELSERHNNQFFGTGETFLFTLSPDVECYKWTAENDLILRANDHELIIGSGGGAYGLWLDSELNHGSSNTCTAFKNPPLCGAQEQFSCIAIEVYSCT